MTPHDRPVFATEMAILAEQKRVDLTTTLLASYFEDLAEFSINEVRAAIRQARRTTVFLPQPVEIINAITEARRTERLMLATAEHERRMLTAAPGEEQDAAQARGRFAALVESIARRFTSSAASKRTLADIDAEFRRLQATPPDPEHEDRKREALGRFLEPSR